MCILVMLYWPTYRIVNSMAINLIYVQSCLFSDGKHYDIYINEYAEMYDWIYLSVMEAEGCSSLEPSDLNLE